MGKKLFFFLFQNDRDNSKWAIENTSTSQKKKIRKETENVIVKGREIEKEIEKITKKLIMIAIEKGNEAEKETEIAEAEVEAEAKTELEIEVEALKEPEPQVDQETMNTAKAAVAATNQNIPIMTEIMRQKMETVRQVRPKRSSATMTMKMSRV